MDMDSKNLTAPAHDECPAEYPTLLACCGESGAEVAGAKVWSRRGEDGKFELGEVTGRSGRLCPVCGTANRVKVLWGDGRRSYPCGESIGVLERDGSGKPAVCQLY